MTNLCNRGYFEGRLVSAPVFFPATGGGRVVSIKVACKRNFTSNNGRDSDFIEFRDFVSPSAIGNRVYDFLETGDLIKIEYELRSSVGTSQDGSKTYYQQPQIQHLMIAESRRVREARRQAKQEATPPNKN